MQDESLEIQSHVVTISLDMLSSGLNNNNKKR